MRRRLFIQIAFFLLQNPLLGNFFNGSVYQGGLKRICTPGLNCHSCPAAIASCPIGAMQISLAGARQSVGLFVTGFLLATGAVFGRFICGYVCPMGLMQDLLYKIKAPKIKPQFKWARFIKYAVLALLVIILPLSIRHEHSGLGSLWFCRYLCPSGTIFGAWPLLAANDFLRSLAGWQFVLKSSVAIGIILTSVFVFRFFCRILCPLGAIYALFNKIALFRAHQDKDKCVSCESCREACDIRLEPDIEPNSPECIRCGDCVKACSNKALGYRRK